MSIEKCRSVRRESKIKIEELKRKAVFHNPGHIEFVTTRVDGCAMKNCEAADWLIERLGFGQIIIELKGKNVEKGISQVSSTAAHWQQNHLRQGKLAALIVCSQFPQANTGVQKAKQAFAKKYGAQLHVVCGNREYQFEHVFGANPLKA